MLLAGKTVIDKQLTSSEIINKDWIRWFLPRRVNGHKIFSGPLQGKTIYTSWHDYPRAILGWAEPSLLKWFQDNIQPGETWLDIGAYHGYTAIAMSKLVGSSGRVFAFEPEISAASALSRTKQANDFRQLSVIPIALGDSREMTLVSGSSFRGMFQPGSAESDNSHSSSEFLSTSFDLIWEAIAGENSCISGVKMDVQGFEINVLRGMMETLKKYHPKLVIEIHNGVNRKEFLSVIEECGYSSAGIPIEPMPGEESALFYDDRNYAFL